MTNTEERDATCLRIRERNGELALTLKGDTLEVTPDNSLRHVVAERMGRAASASRSPILDGRIARVRASAAGDAQSLWGTFPVSGCSVSLSNSRLHIRVLRQQTSFGPNTFELSEAERFVQQFNRARADS